MVKKKIKIIPRSRKCALCESLVVKSWRDTEEMEGYLSSRGRILNRKFTGVCAKHQKLLAAKIKQARHLGLLPFVTKLEE